MTERGWARVAGAALASPRGMTARSRMIAASIAGIARCLIDATIRPILAARVFSGNATRARRDPRVQTGGARS